MYIELVENNVRKKRTLTDLDLNVFDGGRTAAPTQTRKEHLNSAQHVTLWGASSHHWAKGPKYCRWTDQTIDVDVWSSTGGGRSSGRCLKSLEPADVLSTGPQLDASCVLLWSSSQGGGWTLDPQWTFSAAVRPGDHIYGLIKRYVQHCHKASR